MTNDEKIQLIGQKIVVLSNHLDKYKAELEQLRQQLEVLKQNPTASYTPPAVPDPILPPKEIVPPPKEEIRVPALEITPITPTQLRVEPLRKTPPPPVSGNLEEKIGARVFSIIGIIMLVLGIAIGVKYAIDRDLINETSRLVLGYLAGSILLAFSMFYKKKYETFSAILLSGGMAVMYFTTYVGYAYYHKYPPSVAFVIMALFTAFTVYSAHVYNYEVIALIGLVGGYALPPLLSTGGGEIQYMFGFMLILNAGILVLSFLKDWRFVNHVAYGLTWLIFAMWMFSEYTPERYFGRTMSFATLFYLIFYLSFLSYKLFKKKAFEAWDVVLILSNSMIYFGIGYNALNHAGYEQWQGLFAIANALIHLSFAALCKQKESGDKTLFHFIIAMVISFITMAIPIQMDGNYVTLAWLSEMLVLLWMSQRFGVNLYRWLGYGMAVLALASLVDDWMFYAYVAEHVHYIDAIPLLRSRYFLTGLLAIAAFWLARWLNARTKPLQEDEAPLLKVASIGLITIALLVTFITFLNEINLYFNQQFEHSHTAFVGPYADSYQVYDDSWRRYQSLWVMIYLCVFTAIMGVVNLRKYRNVSFTYITWALSLVCLLVCLTGGLFALKSLRSEMMQAREQVDFTSGWNLGFHYIFILFVLLHIGLLYVYRNSALLKPVREINYWVFHAAILVVLSVELMHFVVSGHIKNAEPYAHHVQRIGYTVLWGLYSMSLIVYGILRKQKQVRIIAITLFGLTILKLIVDAISMEKGSRLVVFIIIGIILLTVSFLYQKFRALLFGEENEENDLPKTPIDENNSI